MVKRHEAFEKDAIRKSGEVEVARFLDFERPTLEMFERTKQPMNSAIFHEVRETQNIQKKNSSLFVDSQLFLQIVDFSHFA